MREVILDADPASNAPFRLPEAIVPIHYDIGIEPELASNTFEGIVHLDFEVAEATKVIIFHALRLKVTVASITLDGDGKQPAPRIGYTPEHEAAYAELDEELSVGSKGRLTLHYDGHLTGQGSMGGLYPTPYQFPGGEMKWGFESMMQPTMARAVYPCLDEPDRKATFNVSLIVDPDLKALSNMEVADEQPVTTKNGQKKKVSFKTTPKMSTYLVVLIGGYFNVLETDEFTVPVRVWTPPDKDVKDGAYALELAVKALQAHEGLRVV
jgi:aminopeptidase 2